LHAVGAPPSTETRLTLLIAERNPKKFCTKKPHTQQGSSSERDYNINPTLGGAGERERPLRKKDTLTQYSTPHSHEEVTSKFRRRR
jgi:hypothetical protein